MKQCEAYLRQDGSCSLVLILLILDYDSSAIQSVIFSGYWHDQIVESRIVRFSLMFFDSRLFPVKSSNLDGIRN